MSKIAEQAVDQPEAHTEGRGRRTRQLLDLARENVALKHELGRIGSPDLAEGRRATEAPERSSFKPWRVEVRAAVHTSCPGSVALRRHKGTN